MDALMRITTTSIGLLLGIALATPAFAAASDNVIQNLSSCKATDKKCVSDMQKRWQREQRDFDRAQQKKLNDWRDANPQTVSAEWEQARRAYSEVLRKEAIAFREDLKKRQKEFYDALKDKLPTGDSRLKATGSQITLPGQAECTEKFFSNPEMYRLCLRGKRVEFLLKQRQQAIDKTKAESGE